MSQSDGDITREEIRKILKNKNLKSSDKNVEFIFRKHLADPEDRPLIELIENHEHSLK